ncbi:MAG: hypothetical protein HHAS10_06650 [Candidatus Altimarinota bacterium]
MGNTHLGQKSYFNPLSEGFSLIGGALKGTMQGTARVVVDFNNAVAQTLGFKNANGLSIAGLALAGGLYFGAPTLSGPVAATTGVTQAAVTTTLQNTGIGIGIASGADLAINATAKKLAGKNYRR